VSVFTTGSILNLFAPQGQHIYNEVGDAVIICNYCVLVSLTIIGAWRGNAVWVRVQHRVREM